MPIVTSFKTWIRCFDQVPELLKNLGDTQLISFLQKSLQVDHLFRPHLKRGWMLISKSSFKEVYGGMVGNTPAIQGGVIRQILMRYHRFQINFHADSTHFYTFLVSIWFFTVVPIHSEEPELSGKSK